MRCIWGWCDTELIIVLSLWNTACTLLTENKEKCPSLCSDFSRKFGESIADRVWILSPWYKESNFSLPFAFFFFLPQFKSLVFAYGLYYWRINIFGLEKKWKEKLRSKMWVRYFTSGHLIYIQQPVYLDEVSRFLVSWFSQLSAYVQMEYVIYYMVVVV